MLGDFDAYRRALHFGGQGAGAGGRIWPTALNGRDELWRCTWFHISTAMIVIPPKSRMFSLGRNFDGLTRQ